MLKLTTDKHEVSRGLTAIQQSFLLRHDDRTDNRQASATVA